MPEGFPADIKGCMKDCILALMWPRKDIFAFFIGLSDDKNNPLEGWVLQRLKHLEAVLEQRAWLAAGQFTVADILMADALRVPKVRAAGDFPALRSYVDRACARPAFKRAYDGQMAHFAKGDR